MFYYVIRKFSFTGRIANSWSSPPNVVVVVDSVDVLKFRLNFGCIKILNTIMKLR